MVKWTVSTGDNPPIRNDTSTGSFGLLCILTGTRGPLGEDATVRGRNSGMAVHMVAHRHLANAMAVMHGAQHAVVYHTDTT